MLNFKTTESLVYEILQENPQARKDDYILMLKVCEKMCPKVLNYPFWLVMKNHNTNNLPKWETVTRCRRKLQSKYPELANKKAKQERMKKQEDYITYAKS